MLGKDGLPGEASPKKIDNLIKYYSGEFYWFLKFLIKSLYADAKRLISNQRTYIYVIIFILVYSFLYQEEKINIFFIWLILLLAILFDIWKVGDWKAYQRKEKKKKYFSLEHPDKKSNSEADYEKERL